MLPLLRTKTILPPPRPKRVQRLRLMKQLEEGMLRALTLVVAPAGFGKTTLVVDWAHSVRYPVAWLSLDAEDHSAERFLSYLIQAIQSIQDTAGQSALTLLHSGQKIPLEVLLSTFLNDLSEIPHDFAVILDDYHTCEGSEIARIVNFLVEHRPSCFHLVIVSRTTPALHLTRMRATDQIVEITAADLRFTDQEIQIFVEDVLGAHLTSRQISGLSLSTEGWAVGLQLAGMTLARQTERWTLPAGQEHIFNYLAGEVFSRETPETQTFLKVTALFDRFCLSLCEYLYATPEFQAFHETLGASAQPQVTVTPSEILRYIDQSNLFLVSLDPKRTWFRYHALFTEFLRSPLPPDPARALLRVAVDWFEQNGLVEDAIQLALRAGDDDRAANLLEAVYRDLLIHGEHARLLDWLNRLPSSMISNRPRLALAKAWIGAILFDMVMADTAAQLVEPKIPAGEPGNLLRGELLTLRILIESFQGISSSTEHYNEAFVLLSEQDDFLHNLLHFNLGLTHVIRGETALAIESLSEAVRLSEKLDNHLVMVVAGTQLGEQLQIHGELAKAERVFQHVIRYTQETIGERSPIQGMPLVSYADLLRELNRIDEAIACATQGIAYCQIWQPLASLDGWLTMARLEAGRKNSQASYQYLEQATHATENTVTIMDDTFVSVQRVRAHLVQKDLAAAEYWIKLQRLKELLPEMYPHLQDLAYLTFLRVDFLSGRRSPEEIVAELEAQRPSLELRERTSALIEAILLSVLALDAAGKPSLSAAALNQALTLASQCGYIRLVVDEGPALLALIKKYHDQLTTSPEYVEKISQLIEPAGKMESAPRGNDLPLTRRELDILALIAVGMSNQEIAVKRVLTVNTVKKHVANILSKLGVANRTQAVALARQKGWIT